MFYRACQLLVDCTADAEQVRGALSTNASFALVRTFLQYPDRDYAVLGCELFLDCWLVDVRPIRCCQLPAPRGDAWRPAHRTCCVLP